MSQSFEKSVKGATKQKLAAPKSKYVEHLLVATHAGDAGVAEVFRTLTHRLRDSTWTIVFKGLIIVHLMIREGEPNVTLRFLSESPTKVAISNFSDVQVQGGNIRHYYNYILSRAKSYRETRVDWIREGQGRLKRQTIDKGLLRETETVQRQISALLKCNLLSNDPDNEITLTAFRLLTMDLLILFHVMNEGTINVLEHYFEMSKVDAQRALNIYKTFSKQTSEVVEYLSVARQYEHATRLEIPKLKHAPTSLTSSLEEYLNDPDFEINRRQYLAQQDAKKGGKSSSNGTSNDFKKVTVKATSTSAAFPEPKAAQAAASKQEPKGPAPDLIDFFESIEQNQQPMAGQAQRQSSSFQPVSQYQYQQQPFSAQPTYQSFQSQPPTQQQMNGSLDSSNPFGQMITQQPQQQMQSNFTGAGFGGFSQQTTVQPPVQTSQPFSPPFSSIPQTQSGPFATHQPTFAPQQQTLTTGQQPQSTNPFRQSMMPPAAALPLQRQSTNPFSRHLNPQQSDQTQSTPFSPASMQSPMSIPSSTTSAFFSTPLQSPQPNMQAQPAAQPLQPTRTGTNPFARSSPQSSQPPPTSTLMPNPTGSTNPFRQSQFVNPQTGQGWQATQGTMGGLENLETIPFFPRPGQQMQPQQQQQPWPH
ncbi:hypothetical protein MMC30_002408 [Trapelia coarctata]|nr:hypothetical protein [Trapelia coarctata]